MLWGWPHCVQDQELTQLAVDRRLTVIAFEAMNHWKQDGSFDLHVFHTNNELAGYASVLHALTLAGTTGNYGPRRSAVVIGFGATARGAVTALTALGIGDVDILTHRQVAAVASPIHSARILHFDPDDTAGRVSHAVTPEGRVPLAEFLGEHDIIVNCVLQDTDNPLVFVHHVVHGRQVRPGRFVEAHGAGTDLMSLDGLVGIGSGRERHLSQICLAPCSSTRHIFQHQRSVGRSARFVTGYVAVLRNGQVEKAKSHPAGSAELHAIPATRLGDFCIKLGVADLVPPGNDGIGEVLPDNREKATRRLIPITCEAHRPTDMDHGVAAARQPIDIGHVVEFDSNDRLAGKREPVGQVPFEQRCFSEKARSNRKPARAALGICDNTRRQLPRPRSRPEMGRHAIDASRFEAIAHRSVASGSVSSKGRAKYKISYPTPTRSRSGSSSVKTIRIKRQLLGFMPTTAATELGRSATARLRSISVPRAVARSVSSGIGSSSLQTKRAC